MKLIKRCLTLLAVAVLAVALIVLRPTADEFAAYYVSRNQTGLGGFFDEGLEAMVRERTEEDNYLFFSVFEVDGDEVISSAAPRQRRQPGPWRSWPDR